MNTTLVIRYGADDAELERQRTGEDKFEVYNLVLEWLWKNETTSVKVEMIDSTDTCVHCYTATPVE